MWGLDIPSTIQFQMPDYRGDIQIIGGWAQEQAGRVYSSAKAAVDPVLKAPVNAAFEAKGYLQRAAGQGEAAFFDTISSVLEGARDTAKAVTEPLSSGLKWGVAIAIIGIALYALAIVSPLLPRRTA